MTKNIVRYLVRRPHPSREEWLYRGSTSYGVVSLRNTKLFVREADAKAAAADKARHDPVGAAWAVVPVIIEIPE